MRMDGCWTLSVVSLLTVFVTSGWRKLDDIEYPCAIKLCLRLQRIRTHWDLNLDGYLHRPALN